MGYIHWLSERKGADRLPAIIDAIHRIRQDIHVVIIGDGPLLYQLESKINESNYSSLVTVVGEGAKQRKFRFI